MKKVIIFLCLIFLNGCNSREAIKNIDNIEDKQYKTTMKQDILSIMMAYPGYIVDIKVENDNVYLITKGNQKIIYDHKTQKSDEEKLNNPSIKDVLEQIYPLNDIDTLPEQNFNPGRVRLYSLLKEVYGHTKEQIESNLVNVKCGYRNYPFNSKNNAAKSLEKAMKEVSLLAEQSYHIRNCLYPISGTYNFRYIAGTNRLSPHAFGIAIDLARDNRDYWKWASREQGQARLSSYSKEIVRIFEKNNFIWGGKWGYFDILHFEYRPELIIKSRYFSKKESNGIWYEGVPLNEEIKKYIQLIDSKLE
ncbi:D-alanyl-D-alanine carboxypeptidase [Alkalithermobacter thermoalcaliphilus JW-YL-7 = DSM 7308]|uniref:D-alanyl-D-alanine carboxypeptidase n=1 Tax=Alkalithermobacter thermoalcaliphilus JW-YL-7 = DSM 7308 TaxID=1121328 RepID=A0A150FSS6_CLOPD|nr:hypothetical protein JWYL7_1756 [[Clostridium] paradoxum JW-YL-7 = DSM 7308]SHL17876.1 D-alanyl-D-alanine carboxypeptidase [[Clostridium] paradoxum JW-YL-7 = DSM 7308]